MAMTEHTCTNTNYDFDEVVAEPIFNDGRYSVDAMVHPDGALCEFQVFKWRNPFAWEDSGRWYMIAAGDPTQWEADVPHHAKDAANAWLSF